MPRYGLIVDVHRCIGCYACVVACKSENYTRPGVSWIGIDVREEGQFPKVLRTYTPRLCLHCATMPCAQACPMDAIYRNENGIVLIDPERCRCNQSLCTAACPFGAISINQGRAFYFEPEADPGERMAYEAHREGTAEKCTLCTHRLDVGELPLCVQSCPTKALLCGDLDDRKSEVHRLVADGVAVPYPGSEALAVSVFYRTR